MFAPLISNIVHYFKNTYNIALEYDNTALFKVNPDAYIKLDDKQVIIIISCAANQTKLNDSKSIFLKCYTSSKYKLANYKYYFLFAYSLSNVSMCKTNMYINSIANEPFELLPFEISKEYRLKRIELSKVIFELLDNNSIVRKNDVINDYMEFSVIVQLLNKYFDKELDKLNELIEIFVLSFACKLRMIGKVENDVNVLDNEYDEYITNDDNNNNNDNGSNDTDITNDNTTNLTNKTDTYDDIVDYIEKTKQYIDYNNPEDYLLFDLYYKQIKSIPTETFKYLWNSMFNVYISSSKDFTLLTNYLRNYIIDNTFDTYYSPIELIKFMCKLCENVVNNMKNKTIKLFNPCFGNSYIYRELVKLYQNVEFSVYGTEQDIKTYRNVITDFVVMNKQCNISNVNFVDVYNRLNQNSRLSSLNNKTDENELHKVSKSYVKLDLSKNSKQTNKNNQIKESSKPINIIKPIYDLCILEPNYNEQISKIKTLDFVYRTMLLVDYLVVIIPKSCIIAKSQSSYLSKIYEIAYIDKVIELGNNNNSKLSGEIVIMCLRNKYNKNIEQIEYKIYDLTDYANAKHRKKVPNGGGIYRLSDSLMKKLDDINNASFIVSNSNYDAKIKNLIYNVNIDLNGNSVNDNNSINTIDISNETTISTNTTKLNSININNNLLHSQITNYIQTQQNIIFNYFERYNTLYKEYKHNCTKSLNLSIYNPYTNNTQQLLLQYIKYKQHEISTLPNVNIFDNLNEFNFKLIRFGDVFKIVKRTVNHTYQTTISSNGSVPLFGCKSTNYGISSYVDEEEYEGDVLVIVNRRNGCCGYTWHYNGKLAWNDMCHVYELNEKYKDKVNLDITAMLLTIQISPQHNDTDRFKKEELMDREYYLYIDDSLDSVNDANSENETNSINNANHLNKTISTIPSFDIRLDLIKYVQFAHRQYLNLKNSSSYPKYICSKITSPSPYSTDEILNCYNNLTVDKLKYVNFADYFKFYSYCKLCKNKDPNGIYPVVGPIISNNGISRYADCYVKDFGDPQINEYPKDACISIIFMNFNQNMTQNFVGSCFVHHGKLGKMRDVELYVPIKREYDKSKINPIMENETVYGIDLVLNSYLITAQLNEMFRERGELQFAMVKNSKLWLVV